MAKTAPASSTALSCSGLVTVPAPTMALGTSLAIRRMASRPTGVRRVISRVGMPPSTRAWDKSTAVLKSSIAITGTTAPAVRISRGVSLDISILQVRWGCRFVEVKRDGGLSFQTTFSGCIRIPVSNKCPITSDSIIRPTSLVLFAG